jgi:hypothetical protein
MWRGEIGSDLEITGNNLAMILDAFGPFELLASRYLLDAGVGTEKDGHCVLDRNGWYPLADVLTVFDRIGKEVGPMLLYKTGWAVIDHAPFPPRVDDLEALMHSVNVAYHLSHRKARRVMYDSRTGTLLPGIGSYTCTRGAGQKGFLMLCDNPYPCDFDRGVIARLIQSFGPSVAVTHQDGPCRKKGEPSCTYRIVWNAPRRT